MRLLSLLIMLLQKTTKLAYFTAKLHFYKIYHILLKEYLCIQRTLRG